MSVRGTQLISRTKQKHNLEEIKDLINKELSTTQEQGMMKTRHEMN